MLRHKEYADARARNGYLIHIYPDTPSAREQLKMLIDEYHPK